MVNKALQCNSQYNPNVAELTELKIIRLDPGLPIPSRAHPYDAGIDLFSTDELAIPPFARILVGTGIAVDIPPGYVGLVHPRSGLAWKQGLSIVNAPGTIDCGYQGEIKICLINLDAQNIIQIHRGDRIAQLLIEKIELPTLMVVDNFEQISDRGQKGYGSTGGHQSLME